jgi:beta-lactamase class A
MLLSTLLQLLYPHDRLTPFSWVDGVYLGSVSKEHAKEALESLYNESTIEINGNDGFSKTFHFSELGVQVDEEQEVDAYLGYPLWQRFIPFTILKNAVPKDVRPKVTFTQENALDFSQSMDAGITLEDGIKVVPEQVTFKYDKDALRIALEQLNITARKQSYSIDLDISEQYPSIRTTTAQTLADTLSKNLQKGLDFSSGDEELHVDQAEVLKWLEIVPSREDGSLKVNISTDKALEFLTNTLKDEQIRGSVDETVTLLNGVETGRTSGRAGKAINVEDLASSLNAAILGGEGNQIKLMLVDVAPQLVYKREFTSDWAGLSGELSYRYGGKAVAIDVVDLTGRGHNFSLNADRVFTAASTYKLFTALSMFRSGNVPGCFEDMIINSANACPQEFLGGYGYSRSTEDAHSIGAYSTDFVKNGMQTTASDLALYLQKLYSGTLLAPDQSARLLNAMKTQRYRQGIPAGVGERGVVADKVGFLDGLLHDAGIVYSEKGNYICVIMTDGQSWGEIASIARLIQDKF